jgi:hypothetical protein
MVQHKCNTYRGMSGSPLWAYDEASGRRTICAVHKARPSPNSHSACQIGSSVSYWFHMPSHEHHAAAAAGFHFETMARQENSQRQCFRFRQKKRNRKLSVCMILKKKSNKCQCFKKLVYEAPGLLGYQHPYSNIAKVLQMVLLKRGSY